LLYWAFSWHCDRPWEALSRAKIDMSLP
jgi:hypothetical protein